MAEQKKEAGNKAFQAGKFEDAVELYSDAIELDDMNHVYYANRAAAYLALKQWEEARTDAKKAIAIQDNYQKAYLRLATAEKELGNKEGALKACKTGIALAEKTSSNAKKSGANEFKKLERELKQKGRSDERDRIKNVQTSIARGGQSTNPEETMQEMGRVKLHWQYKLHETSAKAQNKIREHQEKQIVIAALEKECEKRPDMNALRRVGKAYMMRDAKKVLRELRQEKSDLENEVNTLGRAEKKVKSELEDSNRRLFEYQKAMFESQQAAAR